MTEITTAAALLAYYNSLVQAKSVGGLSAAAVAQVAFNQVVKDTNAGLIDPGIAAAFLVPLINPGLTDPNIASSFLTGLQAPRSTGAQITTTPQLQAYFETLLIPAKQPDIDNLRHAL